MPANEMMTPSHWRRDVRSRRVKALRMTTNTGIAAMSMDAAEALVRAIPMFSKLK